MAKAKPKTQHIPVTLQILTKKLAFEVKRLVYEKEDGIVKHVVTKMHLHGISTLIFKNKEGKNVTLSYRHDANGTLRFAREQQYEGSGPLPTETRHEAEMKTRHSGSRRGDSADI